MGIMDMVKRGFEIANKNYMLVVINVALYISFLVAGIIAFAFLAIMSIGSFEGLSTNPDQLETMVNALATSVGLIVVMVFGFMFFMLLFYVTYAYIQAGTIGTVLATARGEVSGFDWDVFWEKLKSHGLSILWLNILWGLIALAIFLILGIIALVGVMGVLMPINEQGNTMLAFGIGVPFIAILVLFYMFCLFIIYAGTIMSGVVLINKRIDAISAMSESLTFVKANFWDILLISLLMIGVSMAVGMAFGFVRMFMSFIPVIGPLVDIIVLVPLQYAVNIYVAVIVTAAYAVMLLDRTGELPTLAPAYGYAPQQPVSPGGQYAGTVPSAPPAQPVAPIEPVPPAAPDTFAMPETSRPEAFPSSGATMHTFTPPAEEHIADYAVEPSPAEVEAEIREESPEEPEGVAPFGDEGEDFLMVEPVEEEGPEIEIPSETTRQRFVPPAPEPPKPAIGSEAPIPDISFPSEPAPPVNRPTVQPPPFGEQEAGQRQPLNRPPLPERPPLDRPVPPPAPPRTEPDDPIVTPKPARPVTPPVIEPESWPPFEPARPEDEEESEDNGDDKTRPG